MQNSISIRRATKDDAKFIAQVEAMAIGDSETLQEYCGENYIQVLTEIAYKKGTQYSWENALIAIVDNCLAGAIIAYDGSLLNELREGTLKVIFDHTAITHNIKDETQAGEYYIDAVAVSPKFRGLGVAEALVGAICTDAFSKGFDKVGLIVDYDNRNAESLYFKLGFEIVDYKNFFGHRMKHLQKERPSKIINVVAAIIIKDGELFATQRGYGDWSGWWEFPGGKIEQGETQQQALKREIMEELDCEIEVGEHFETVEWFYPKFHLIMNCYLCKFVSEGIHLIEHKDSKWLNKDELYSVNWLPADIGLVEKLSGYLK